LRGVAVTSPLFGSRRRSCSYALLVLWLTVVELRVAAAHVVVLWLLVFMTRRQPSSGLCVSARHPN
jgi:hypothetical protein